MVLFKHDWGEDTQWGHHSGGVGPLVGGVQITFSLCSVPYCLPARGRRPSEEGVRAPGGACQAACRG